MLRRLALLATSVLLLPALVSPPAIAGGAPTNALRQVTDLPTVAMSPYADWFWARPDKVATYRTASGDIAVATLLKEEGTQLSIATYDAATLAQQGTARIVTFDGWPQWGGMLVAPDGSFLLLTGRSNPEQEIGLPVIAVRRFTPDWQPDGVAYLASGTFDDNTDIYQPFDGVKAAMVVVGDRLVVHTARTRYESSDGDHHQTNLTFEVDLDTMEATRFDAAGDAPFTSHSLAQLGAMNGDDLVLVDHGDAEPRALQLSVMADYPTSRTLVSSQLMTIGGDWGVNATGLTATGLISGPHGVVVLGTSVRQGAGAWDPGEARNLYAVRVDPRTGAKQTTWLTAFPASGSTSAGEPRVVQVGADRFVVLSDVARGSSHQLQYRLMDSAGQVLATRSFADTFYSGISQPAKIGDRVFWVAKSFSDQEYSAWMYALDISSPSSPVFVTASRGFSTTPTPTIAGAVRVGSTLTVKAGDWGAERPVLSYQWRSSGRAIPGATKSTFVPQAAQVGKTVTVTVTARKTGYTQTSRTSRPTAAVARGRLVTAVPRISGTAAVGNRLTARPGRWRPSGVRLSYRWYASGRLIPRAASRTLRVSTGLRGKRITVRITGSKPGYETATRTAKATRPVRR